MSLFLKVADKGAVIMIDSVSREGFFEYGGTIPACAEGEGLYYVDGVVVAKKPEASKAEQEARRASAYRDRVDPITCEIQRLRDMGGTPEEIAEAEQRRAEAVRAVKDEYPYPQEGEK